MSSTRSRSGRFPAETPANSRASSPLSPAPSANIPLADQPPNKPNVPPVDQPLHDPNVPLVDPTSTTSAATAADIITSILPTTPLPDRPRTPDGRVDSPPSGAGGTSASQGGERQDDGARGPPVTPSKASYPARNKRALRVRLASSLSGSLADDRLLMARIGPLKSPLDHVSDARTSST